MARICIFGANASLGAALGRAFRSAQDEVIPVYPGRVDPFDMAGAQLLLSELRPEIVILAGTGLSDPGPRSAGSAALADLRAYLAVIGAAHEANVARLLLLEAGRLCPQDARGGDVASPGADPFATDPQSIAPIAAIQLLEALAQGEGRDYRTLLAPALYGPGDIRAGAVSSLMAQCHQVVAAKGEVLEIPGTGASRLQYLHVDDLAHACQFVLDVPEARFAAGPGRRLVAVAPQEDISTLGLARRIADIAGFSGCIVTDPGKPDWPSPAPLDAARMQGFGWQPLISLEEGLREAHARHVDRAKAHEAA